MLGDMISGALSTVRLFQAYIVLYEIHSHATCRQNSPALVAPLCRGVNQTFLRPTVGSYKPTPLPTSIKKLIHLAQTYLPKKRRGSPASLEPNRSNMAAELLSSAPTHMLLHALPPLIFNKGENSSNPLSLHSEPTEATNRSNSLCSELELFPHSAKPLATRTTIPAASSKESDSTQV